MDTEFNTFTTTSLDGDFDPSPDNLALYDEVEANEIYDYKDLTRYASAGKGVAKGIIGVATLTMVTGAVMGTVSLGANGSEYPKLLDLAIEVSQTEDSLSYSFSVENPDSETLLFVVSSPSKKAEFNVSEAKAYSGTVVELGYDVDVTWSFEVVDASGNRESRKSETVHTIAQPK